MTSAEQLRAEGELRGELRGKAEGKTESILLVLEARGLRVADEIRARLEQCTDVEQLDQWLQRAATIERTEDLLED